MKLKSFLSALPGMSLVIAAAIVIGCGGGGGGTTTATTATATTSTATTSTATTSTATTATATTSTATTSGATGLTDGSISGVLSANTIYYTSSNNSIRAVNPDGTNDRQLITYDATLVQAAIPHPQVANQWLFSATPAAGGNYGLFRNSTLTTSGAIQIVAPNYNFIDSINVSPDGATVYFVGSVGTGINTLYSVPMTGGTPTRIDDADSAFLNMKGDYLLYSKLVGSAGQLFKIGTAAGSTAIRITTDVKDYVSAQWNKAGDRIVASVAATDYDLYAMAKDGTSLVRLTTTPTISELAASFSPDGSQVAFTSLNNDSTQSGIYKMSSTAPGVATLVLLSPNVGGQIYWSGTNGRAPIHSFSLGGRRRAPANTAVKPR